MIYEVAKWEILIIKVFKNIQTPQKMEIPNKVKAIALENKWYGIEFLYIWKGFKLFTEIQNPDDTAKYIVYIPKVIISCGNKTRLASVNEVLDNIKEWFDESIRAVCTNNLNLEILTQVSNFKNLSKYWFLTAQ